MKNKIIKLSLTFLALLLMLSCDDNDYTKDSTLNTTSPSLSVSLDGFSNSETLVEQEKDYNFTVTISEPQVVNIKVNIQQTGGTATDGVDFTMPHSITIKKGSLSASGVITIHADELKEDTETATIQIGVGNEANVNGVTGQTISFNILNTTSNDLVANLSWAASEVVTDNFGKEIEPTDLADLKLSLTDVPFSQILTGVDGSGFETYTMQGDAIPDGEYYLVADFYDVQDIPTTLDLTLSFDQTGIINEDTYNFPKALNTNFSNCQVFIMAKVIKTGDSYAIESVAKNNSVGLPPEDKFVGDYTVATTSEGQFGPAFDGDITLVDEGNGKRSFEGDWNGFGVVKTYVIEFNDICGTATFSGTADTDLACPGGPGIVHGASDNPAGYTLDDTILVIKFKENINSDCGGVPTEVEITLTKK